MGKGNKMFEKKIWLNSTRKMEALASILRSIQWLNIRRMLNKYKNDRDRNGNYRKNRHVKSIYITFKKISAY